MNPVRHAAAWTYRVLITLFTAAVIVEVFPVGLGVFRAMPGREQAGLARTFEDKVGVPVASGGFLTGGSLLLMIVILIARSGLRSIGATLGLAVLTLVEGARGRAGEDAPVACAFHAINAVLVLGLGLFLGVAREPAARSRTAAAHCTGVRSVDVGPGTGIVGAGRVRRQRT